MIITNIIIIWINFYDNFKNPKWWWLLCRMKVISKKINSISAGNLVECARHGNGCNYRYFSSKFIRSEASWKLRRVRPDMRPDIREIYIHRNSCIPRNVWQIEIFCLVTINRRNISFGSGGKRLVLFVAVLLKISRKRGNRAEILGLRCCTVRPMW